MLADQFAEEGEEGDLQGVGHQPLDGGEELAAEVVGHENALLVNVSQDVDVVEIVPDFGEDDAGEQGQHEHEHGAEGRIAPVQRRTQIMQVFDQPDGVGEQLGGAADEDAQKQRPVVHAEDFHADDQAEDDADFGRSVTEGRQEEFLVAIEQHVGG